MFADSEAVDPGSYKEVGIQELHWTPARGSRIQTPPWEFSGHQDETEDTDDTQDGVRHNCCVKRLISPWYHVVYVFSILILVAGIFVVFFQNEIRVFMKQPSCADMTTTTAAPNSTVTPIGATCKLFTLPDVIDHILWQIVGIGLLICGFWLVVNSDLVVTCIRLFKQVLIFRRNNRTFEKQNKEEAEKVYELKQTKTAFEALDHRFGGNVDQASKEIAKMKSNARANLAINAKQLVLLYCDKDRNRVLDEGAEVDSAFEDLGTVLGGVFPDYEERASLLLRCLKRHRSYRRDRGVHVDKFASLFEMMLNVPKSQIPNRCQEIMDGGWSAAWRSALPPGRGGGGGGGPGRW